MLFPEFTLIYLTITRLNFTEKEDLVNILMQYANGPESLMNNEMTNNVSSSPR